jgi:hypothetical protein
MLEPLSWFVDRSQLTLHGERALAVSQSYMELVCVLLSVSAPRSTMYALCSYRVCNHLVICCGKQLIVAFCTAARSLVAEV